MTYETLLYDVRDGIGVITLNRPAARNAIDMTMRQELDILSRDVRNTESVFAVVLTGAGNAFCGGGDIRAQGEMKRTPDATRKRIQDLQVWLPILANLEKPVIAAVDGPAFGAGFSLALLSDFVFATPEARFCSVFGRIGLVPDLGAFYFLPRIVGLHMAKDIVFTARSIPADEAKSLGIVREIVPRERLMASAMAFAERFRNASPFAIGLSKSILNQSFNLDSRAVGELESYAQGMAMLSEYYTKAVERFQQKQPIAFDWDRFEKESRKP